MDGRAIETKIDTEGNRRPRWVLGPTVKAYLEKVSTHAQSGDVRLTLFAGFVFSFSNILSDSDFGASAMTVFDERIRIQRRMSRGWRGVWEMNCAGTTHGVLLVGGYALDPIKPVFSLMQICSLVPDLVKLLSTLQVSGRIGEYCDCVHDESST